MPDIRNENNNKKKVSGLGRGLGSLLGENTNPGLNMDRPKPANPLGSPMASALQGLTVQPAGSSVKETPQVAPVQATPTVPPEARIWKVGVDKLRPSPFQPRNHFEKEKLEELSISIKNSGIIQPIVVRKSGPNGYEIIAGERRWRAAQLAGLHEVPVVLKELGDRETLELAIIENIQREDLNPMEEAEAYQRLGQEFQLTQQQVAEKVGRERATVANAIRLLQLPFAVREMIARKELSVGHAKILLSVDDGDLQKRLALQVQKEGLTVRKLEKLIKKDGTEEVKDEKSLHQEAVSQRLIGGLTEELQKLLGTKVSIDYSEGKGKLSIQFYTDDQLTSVIDRIRAGCQKS